MWVRDGLASFCREDNVSSAMILLDMTFLFLLLLLLGSFSTCVRTHVGIAGSLLGNNYASFAQK